MRQHLLPVSFAFAAAGCFVVAYLNRSSDVEGAYFEREIGEGWTTYAPFEQSLFNPIDPWNGNLWLGAGIAFVLVALALLILGRFARSG